MAKRTEIIKRINKAARSAGADWNLDREGGKHSVYRLNGLIIPVPRHGEIAAARPRRSTSSASLY